MRLLAYYFLHFLFLGHEAFEPPGPAQRSLQAQYLALSLFFAESQPCLARNDLRALDE